jgi:uncharacterized protein (TIGR00645 family)
MLGLGQGGRAMLARGLERIIFASRWLLVPFYLGLALALALLAIKFVQRLVSLLPEFLGLDLGATFVASLKLVDLTLVGNLLVIVMLVGYDNFVAHIRAPTATARPAWMIGADFGDLKIKLFASIVAIAAIQLLEDFMDVASVNKADLAWRVGILMAFVLVGLLVAVMDRVVGKPRPEA